MNKNNLRFLKTSGVTLALSSLLYACGGNTPEETPSSVSSVASVASSSKPVSSSSKSSVASSVASSQSNGNNGTGLAVNKNWYVELPDGRGGVNVEPVAYMDEMGFDKQASLAAFKETVYPVLRKNCAGCHSTENTSGAGGQAPLHADKDPALAHEYALTRVNFRDPVNSKLVFRLVIDRHNCFSTSCKAAGAEMEAAVKAWSKLVTLPEVPGAVASQFTDQQIQTWIDEDTAKLPAADKEFIKYTSFHVMHNKGVSPLNMNHARVALSKALNTAARWAPKIVNPVDVNGQGILYKFDIRDYWGHTKVDTSASNFKLWFGGSDDDLAFGAGGNFDAEGNKVAFADLNTMKNKLRTAVTADTKFAKLAWTRILKGNVEGADEKNATLPPNIDGFVGTRSTNSGTKQKYIKVEDFKYAEAAQMIYTLTRPDVYNAIMSIPGYATYFEDELGVDKSKKEKSYDWVITYEAITIDTRGYFRAKQNTGKGNFYWKTFDTFATQYKDIDEVYAKQEQNSPFWESPVPKYIAAGGGGGTSPSNYSMIALRTLGTGGERGGGYYTGTDTGLGGQQSAEEVIWGLPNGLQGYALFGGFNQRRVDAFTNIVRDPRILTEVADNILDNYAGFGYPKGSSGDKQLPGVKDVRLNNASSCIGCHSDGMNRGTNDIRDWLDESPARLPKGAHGVDKWINDTAYVAKVKELYKPSKDIRKLMEDDRRPFLDAMGEMKQGMIKGTDKNVYTEPVIWTVEWARKFYQFPVTRSS